MECKRCGACCKFFTLNIKGMSEDERLWLSYHEKCEIKGDYLIIRLKCSHLVRRNRKYICDIHNTEKYPQMCREAPCMLSKEGKVLRPYLNEGETKE